MSATSTWTTILTAILTPVMAAWMIPTRNRTEARTTLRHLRCPCVPSVRRSSWVTLARPQGHFTQSTARRRRASPLRRPPKPAPAGQIDLTADGAELQMRYEAHMHETVEERTARLERKRRRLAAEASGSSLPPPAAVWNNSDWEHEEEEEEEEEEDGAGVGLW